MTAKDFVGVMWLGVVLTVCVGVVALLIDSVVQWWKGRKGAGCR